MRTPIIVIMKILTLISVLLATQGHAREVSLWDNVTLSGAGGWNWVDTDDTHLDISVYERDTNRVDSTSVDGIWKAGIGYHLNHVLVELNVYGTSNTVKGDVWQYEVAQFNNYTFSAPLSSTRLMVDFKPNLGTWMKLTPYIILGVGASWNEASYDEKANSGVDPASTRSLSENTQVQLAWDLGAGMSYDLTKRLSITAEYIYAFLGDATPQQNVNVIKAPEFSYQTQSLLFGISLKL